MRSRRTARAQTVAAAAVLATGFAFAESPATGPATTQPTVVARPDRPAVASPSVTASIHDLAAKIRGGDRAAAAAAVAAQGGLLRPEHAGGRAAVRLQPVRRRPQRPHAPVAGRAAAPRPGRQGRAGGAADAERARHEPVPEPGDPRRPGRVPQGGQEDVRLRRRVRHRQLHDRQRGHQRLPAAGRGDDDPRRGHPDDVPQGAVRQARRGGRLRADRGLQGGRRGVHPDRPEQGVRGRDQQADGRPVRPGHQRHRGQPQPAAGAGAGGRRPVDHDGRRRQAAGVRRPPGRHGRPAGPDDGRAGHEAGRRAGLRRARRRTTST